MHTFTQKLKSAKQATPHKTTKPDRLFLEQNRNVNSILHLQPAIGNQAVLRLLQTDRENSNANKEIENRLSCSKGG